MKSLHEVRDDFDAIARLAQTDSGEDRYDGFLLSLVPAAATTVLDIGCGLGRLTGKLATADRLVVGVDLSPEMIARADRPRAGRDVTFICADFLSYDFGRVRFDCVITAACLHHLPCEAAIQRMVQLLAPGGRLVIHDLRSNAGLVDRIRSHTALAQVVCARIWRTGRMWPPRAAREMWERHAVGETYLTAAQAGALAQRLLPGSQVFDHWLWRYTIVWDKPRMA